MHWFNYSIKLVTIKLDINFTTNSNLYHFTNYSNNIVYVNIDPTLTNYFHMNRNKNPHTNYITRVIPACLSYIYIQVLTFQHDTGIS